MGVKVHGRSKTYYEFSSEKHLFNDLLDRVSDWRLFHTSVDEIERFAYVFSLLGNMKTGEYLEVLEKMRPEPSILSDKRFHDFMEATGKYTKERTDALLLYMISSMGECLI